MVCPAASIRDAEVLMAENAAWVLEERVEFEQSEQQIPVRQFGAGEAFPFLGEPHNNFVGPLSHVALSEAHR